MLEKAIVARSMDKYKDAFDGKDSVSLGEPGFVKSLMYQHFTYYEGPLVARYMVVIQLYSLFERYSIKYSKLISNKENLISISDLSGSYTFKGIKTFFTKVVAVKYSGWNDIDKLRVVRNLIAHCDGYITYAEDKNKILKLAKTDLNLIILSDDRLAMDEEFLKRSLRAVFKFFDIVEPMAIKQDNLLDFSYRHINEFRSFDANNK